MSNKDSFFQDLYSNFNDRNIERVIAQMSADVKWANGMEGGHVYGHQGVREYWTRQFTMVSANVTPIQIDNEGDRVKIKVHQVVHGVEDGKQMADEMLFHLFLLKDGKVAEFDIGEKL